MDILPNTCSICRVDGCDGCEIVLAVIDPNASYDWDNVIPVCRRCAAEIRKQVKPGEFGTPFSTDELYGHREKFMDYLKRAFGGPSMIYMDDFGDDRLCVCGHPYYRHFDTYEDMAPVGCKYCQHDETGCTHFRLAEGQ
jgi:hypothetical protein